jgi:uncharacterized membrane protein
VIDQGAETRRATREAVARLYDIGSRIAFVLLLAGVVLMLWTGIDPRPGSGGPPPLGQWLAGVVGLQPDAFIWAGIGLTAVVPAATVLVAAVGFARSGNRRPALTALAVLALLALTILVASITD